MNENNIAVRCLAPCRDNNKNWRGIIVTCLSLILLGAAPPQPEQEAKLAKKIPMLTLEEAAAAARGAANVKVGGKMNRYVLQAVEFQPTYGQWRAFFEEKEPTYTYDNCFKVFVNDHTKETEFQACP